MENAAEAEVRELRTVIPVERNALGFDVAVHDLDGVQ
jgi:hypothetical protein